MATHSVTINEYKQLSDGQLALKAECCGDPSTHSWLTMAAEVVLDEARCQDSINFHCHRVATLHESMRQALTKAQAAIGSKYVLDPTSQASSAPAAATTPFTTPFPLVPAPAPDTQTVTIQ